MAELTMFLRWLIEYAITGGFWHFVAVLLIVQAITGITTLVRFAHTINLKKEGES